jgi:hypothetical protein
VSPENVHVDLGVRRQPVAGATGRAGGRAGTTYGNCLITTTLRRHHGHMPDPADREHVVALPRRGEVFTDARGDERALRVSWHHDAGLLVLSLWREGTCVGTFRLPTEAVPELVKALADGLAESPSVTNLTDGHPGGHAG